MLLAFLPYTALLLTTTLYAVILNHYQEYIFPRFTWLTVAVGFMLCWFGSFVHLTLVWPDANWQRGLAEVLRAFAIGGLPVVAWKLIEDMQRPRRREAFWKELAHERSAKAVAEERASSVEVCSQPDAIDHDATERSTPPSV